MSNDIRHDKKVTIELDTPFVTNGYYHGHVDGDPKKPFVGKTTVDEGTAEDLENRKKIWAAYDASRHRNNGRIDMNAGNLSGSGN